MRSAGKRGKAKDEFKSQSHTDKMAKGDGKEKWGEQGGITLLESFPARSPRTCPRPRGGRTKHGVTQGRTQ